MSPPGTSNHSTSRDDAEAAWIEHYKKFEVSSSDLSGERSLRRYTLYQRAVIDETLSEIDNRLRSTAIVPIWSAGSGIDTISLYLKRIRQASVRFTLQDISRECMAYNEMIFAHAGLEAEFIVGDLFDSEHHEEFDIVVNTGLLEHFTPKDQSKLLKIFSDALKPRGVYITATPYGGAKLYPHFKRRMESIGTWEVGPERPIMTLKGVESGDLVLMKEHQIAARDQLILVKGAYPALGRALQPFITALEMLPDRMEPPLIRIIGGYCLLDKFQKKRF